MNAAARAAVGLGALLWEAPQTLLGALVYAALRVQGGVRRPPYRMTGRLICPTRSLGVSLGYFVFCPLRGGPAARTRIRAHELGHAVQSRLLGPAYLPVVGLPSFVRATYARVYRRVKGRPWRRYYDGFPERWADRLGKVSRDR